MATSVLIVFDRIFDLSRTAVNIRGDADCAVLVAHRSGGTGWPGSPRVPTATEG